MEISARDPERVIALSSMIFTRPEADELDEDESFIADMLEKSLSEFFVDHVIWPLIGVTIVSLLVLVIAGSLWMSAKLVLDLKALLT